MPVLEENPNFEPILTRYKEAVAAYPQALVKFKEDTDKWNEAAAKAKAEGKPAPGNRPGPPSVRAIRTPPPASTTR